MDKLNKAGDAFAEDKSVVLSDDGIYYYTAGSRIFAQWNEITECKKSGNYLFIAIGNKTTFFIARNVFVDEEEEDKFVSILKEHIK